MKKTKSIGKNTRHPRTAVTLQVMRPAAARERKAAAGNDNWPLSWRGPGLGHMIYLDEPYRD